MLLKEVRVSHLRGGDGDLDPDPEAWAPGSGEDRPPVGEHGLAPAACAATAAQREHARRRRKL